MSDVSKATFLGTMNNASHYNANWIHISSIYFSFNPTNKLPFLNEQSNSHSFLSIIYISWI